MNMKIPRCFTIVFFIAIFTLSAIFLIQIQISEKDRNLMFMHDKSMIDPENLLVQPGVGDKQAYFSQFEHDQLVIHADWSKLNLPAYLNLEEFKKYLKQRTLHRKDLEKLWRSMLDYERENPVEACVDEKANVDSSEQSKWIEEYFNI